MPAAPASSPATAPHGLRVGIDVGGTFTDVAVHDLTSGELFSFKVPSTPREPSQALLTALRRILDGRGTVTEGKEPHSAVPVEAVVHGTTVATNTLLERKGGRVALITTRGFRDVLEIGRQYRSNIYNLRDSGRPEPLVPRHLRLEVTERLDGDGRVLRPLDESELPGLIETLRRERIEAVAVCLLHAYANPVHERLLRERLTGMVPFVTLSSDINPEYREYERASTTVANAYVTPVVGHYLAGLEEELARLRPAGLAGQLLIIQSSGSVMTIEAARHRAINTFMSGPAAGVAATRFLLDQLGLPNGLTFDMGGTSTDVCLIYRGAAAVAKQMRIAGQPVRVPAVSIETIGAGGGSIGWVDSVGALKVGPQSAGADPGPACYGKGGDQPTLTDAYAVLGYVDPEGMFAQSIRVHRELAERAIRPIAERYRYGIPAAAEALLEIANANMNRALRLVSVEKGYDLREFALIAFGGAGPIHAARLAQQLGIPRVVVPHLSGAFSAFGGLVSDVRHDYVRTYLASLGPDGTSPEPGGETRSGLDTAFGDLESLVASDLARVGYNSRAVRLARSVDLRYHGQNYEIEVPLPRRGAPAAALRARFHQIHRKLYSYALPDSTIECVNIRVAATVASARPSLPRLRSQPDGVAGEPGGKKPPTLPSTPASRTKRPAYFAETGPVDLPVFDRATLGPGVGISGPAVVEEPWSTTLVYPGQTATVDAFGNLLIEVQT